MRACIFGLGAVGGLIAARLARSGVDVCAVSRGATLEAVQRHGLRTVEGGVDMAPVRFRVSSRPADIGPQELVIVTLKGQALAAALDDICSLLGPETVVLTVMNGVPWWFRHGLGPVGDSLNLERVDPGGACSRAIDPSRVVGAVANLSAQQREPGVVVAPAGAKLTIGEPMGGAGSERCLRISSMLREAGFHVEASPRIQQTVWFKLWGNMSANPISAITGATTDRLLDDDDVRAFMTRCMNEAALIGDRLGLHIDDDAEARHAVTRRLGVFKTSMLQDVEAGRSIELDALVGVVVDIARQLHVPVPNIEALFGLARLQATVRGLYESHSIDMT